MSKYKRAQDGSRIRKVITGERTRPGVYYSQAVRVGDQETFPAYLADYKNGWLVERAPQAKEAEVTP